MWYVNLTKGVILYAMLRHTVPWRESKLTDKIYSTYVNRKHELYGFKQFDLLPEGPKVTLYQLMNQDPVKRLNLEEVKLGSWLNETDYCHVVDDVVVSDHLKHIHVNPDSAKW